MSRSRSPATALSTDELVQRLVQTERFRTESPSSSPEVLGAEQDRRLLAQALQNDTRVKQSRLAFERLLEVIHDSDGLEVTDDGFWRQLEALESALFE